MAEKIARLEARIDQLERRNRTIGLVAIAAVAAVAVSSVVGIDDVAKASSPAATKNQIVDNLRVRHLEVVDPNGITRVRLGAPLPNAEQNGKVLTRGGESDNTASGILLYDYAGRERSGYVTNDKGYSNVLLTLDDAKGEQHALFVSEPGGTTTLRLFNGPSNNAQDKADFQLAGNGPRIHLVQDGKTVFEAP